MVSQKSSEIRSFSELLMLEKSISAALFQYTTFNNIYIHPKVEGRQIHLLNRINARTDYSKITRTVDYFRIHFRGKLWFPIFKAIKFYRSNVRYPLY